MCWQFVCNHFYKAVLLLLALMVIIEFGVGVLNEKSGHLDQVYFTFNLSQTLADAVDGADDYRPSTGDALLAWQSSNASDPFSLSLLTNDSASAVANASQWPATPNVGRKHPRQRMPPPPCPLVSPLLVGPVNVSKAAATSTSMAPLVGPVLAGGRYRPADCRAHHKVAIIIPYRDRQQHLNAFVNHMHPFLQRQQLDYGIYVVSQSGNTPFNRAMLMNIGAAEALRQDAYQCFVFHDVDLLPEDDRNIYSCPEQPRHMSVAIDVFKYKLPYANIFGGVSAMSLQHFVKVNGFSNLFWGWGGEDDDMANRIRFYKLIISRYPASIARYKMLHHKKAKPNPNRFRVMRNGDRRSQNDGLSNLKYKRLDLQLLPLYTEILVDIRPGT